MSASARLFPLWEHYHRNDDDDNNNNNSNNNNNRHHQHGGGEDWGGGRCKVRGGDGGRGEVRGGGGVNDQRGHAAGHEEDLGDDRDSGNFNEESPTAPSEPATKRLRSSPDRNREQNILATQPSPAPPPPPAQEFSVAVNKLLQGALLATPDGVRPRVERMPEKIYRKLRHYALRDEGKVEAGAGAGAGFGWSKCFVCRLSVTSGCACGALELARER